MSDDRRLEKIEQALADVQRWQIQVDNDMTNLRKEGEQREDRIMGALSAISEKQDELKAATRDVVTAYGAFKYVGATSGATLVVLGGAWAMFKDILHK